MLDLTRRRNADSASRALARLEQLELIPLHPYPGSDNWWDLICGRTGCTWTGHLFYSHLRPSRGHNRRHTGCTGTPGTFRALKTDSELLTHLNTVFPGTDFHIHAVKNDRHLQWKDGPEPHHVLAHIGPTQATLTRRVSA